MSQKFKFKDKRLILNLGHPEVGRLLLLSESMPKLAAHWAMAMCLNDGRKILTHITPETREDLIKLDAMSRCAQSEPESEVSLDGKTSDCENFLADLILMNMRKNLGGARGI